MESRTNIGELLAKEIEQLEGELLRAKKAYVAYTGEENYFPIVQCPGSKEQAPKVHKTDIALLVNEALPSFSEGQNFRTEDLFHAIKRDDLDYEKIRSGISSRLARLVEEGKLEKAARGIFRRPVQSERIAPEQKGGDYETPETPAPQ